MRKFVDAWNPLPVLALVEVAGRRICGNCFHAKVVRGTDPDDPNVCCVRGYGPATLSLVTLGRATHPRGFARASRCADFSSMDDDGCAARPPRIR